MSEKGHTIREFDRELRTLRDRLLAMAGRAEQQLRRAIEALVRRDDALAARVIADDQQIDQDEIDIDELALVVLARRQPVASDLRFVMLAMKIVTDLERIGDLGVNIAKRARELRPFPPHVVYPQLEELARKVLAELRRALDAFVAGDAEAAERVIVADPEVDQLNTRVISAVLEACARDADDMARALSISSVSRYLERVGDHATNIAEMVIYYVRGRDVRHHGPTR